jgi:ParE toxin of type II toxin-antitoxin system, parDE
MRNVTVKVRPEALADINALGSVTLKLEAAKYLLRLEREPFLGRPLGLHPTVGDLTGYRKVFFGTGSSHRIVYHPMSDPSAITVDVIAVGPRAELAVYITAVSRIHQPAA